MQVDGPQVALWVHSCSSLLIAPGGKGSGAVGMGGWLFGSDDFRRRAVVLSGVALLALGALRGVVVRGPGCACGFFAALAALRAIGGTGAVAAAVRLVSALRPLASRRALTLTGGVETLGLHLWGAGVLLSGVLINLDCLWGRKCKMYSRSTAPPAVMSALQMLRLMQKLTGM